MHKFSIIFVFALAAFFAQTTPSHACDFEVIIKDHRFSPAEIHIPANEEITLNVHNQDATPEEFESHDLKREKVIPANSKAKIKIGPLKPGTYGFFGEFNQKTAQGKIIAE